MSRLIVFVDAATGEVTRRVPAEELSESMRSVNGRDVVRITMLAVGDRREIHKYAADGALLETVMAHAEG